MKWHAPGLSTFKEPLSAHALACGYKFSAVQQSCSPVTTVDIHTRLVPVGTLLCALCICVTFDPCCGCLGLAPMQTPSYQRRLSLVTSLDPPLLTFHTRGDSAAPGGRSGGGQRCYNWPVNTHARSHAHRQTVRCMLGECCLATVAQTTHSLMHLLSYLLLLLNFIFCSILLYITSYVCIIKGNNAYFYFHYGVKY